MEDENDTEIDQAVRQLKAKHSDRSLHLIEMTSHSGEELQFVMLAPMRGEFTKYREEVESANGNLKKMETAIEKAALNLIKWPDRQKVIEIFDKHPGVIGHFGGQLAKLADADVEFRSKKL